MVESQRQSGHQPFFLLKVEPCELAVVFLGNAGCLEYVVGKLLFGVCCVEHKECQKEHTLVTALQILQDFLCLIAVGGKVAWNDVHIVTGANCLFLFLNGHFLQIGDFTLNRLDCLYLVNRLNVHGDNQAGLHIKEVCQHTVIEFGSEDLQEGHGTQLFADTELLAVSKLKGAWGDEVLYGKSGGCQPVPGKVEIKLLIHVKHPVHQSKALFAVQRFGGYTQPLKVIEQIRLDTVQTGFRHFHSIRFNAEGQILGLDETVVATGKLITEHIRIFGADTVKVIPLGWDNNALSVGVLVCRHIHKGQLEFYRAVEVVEEITPALEDGRFVLVLAELVVDVLELDGLGEVAGLHTADAIGKHSLKGNGVLCRLFLFILVFRSCDGGFNFFSFRPRELSFCGQYDIPPYRVFPAVPVPHRSCWFGTVAAWDAGCRPARCYGQSFPGAVRSFRTWPAS